jgi:hypothetical protein
MIKRYTNDGMCPLVTYERPNGEFVKLDDVVELIDALIMDEYTASADHQTCNRIGCAMSCTDRINGMLKVLIRLRARGGGNG